jgi:tRNA threonylcarbamoyladenosine biosynthesis protein TsaE
MISSSLKETQRIGSQLGSLLRAGDVVALNGPLGSGKTALVGGIARGMNVDPEFSVTSPTFVYAHMYEGSVPLYHLDLYRVERASDLPKLGLAEMLGGQGVAVVEWFERFPQLWPGDRLEIAMEFSRGDERVLNMTGVGSRGIMLAQELEHRT